MAHSTVAKAWITVALMYYSGRPSPKWKIYEDEELYSEIKNATKVDEGPNKLGYRGYLIMGPDIEHATHLDIIVGNNTATLQHKITDAFPDWTDDFREKIHRSIDYVSENYPMDSEQRLEVTLLYFSGRPSPTWTINKGDTLFKEIKEAPKLRQQPGRLGYAGYRIDVYGNNQCSGILLGRNTIALQHKITDAFPDLSDTLRIRVHSAIDQVNT